MIAKPLIAHVLYRLDTGGMERVAVSVINRTGERYRHAVICLAGFGAMREQIEDTSIPCLSLHKKPGKDWFCYFRLWRALRVLKPDLVHTYNIGALDAALIARLAGVRRVVHAEHGRDATDPQGRSRKYRMLRRRFQPFITRYLAVSRELRSWLADSVGIAPARIVFIPNGIDPEHYRGATGLRRKRSLLAAFAPEGTLLIGTVGRLDAVKDQCGLVRAFAILCDMDRAQGARLRLVIVGEGSQRANLERQIATLNLADRVCLLGGRDDVPGLLAECDVFALSSLAEGMPLTALEAMASSLAVVATDVGGVSEVVVDGRTGTLVAPGDPTALAAALRRYVEDASLRAQHGRAGRVRVEAHFGLATMLSAYTALYNELLSSQKRPPQSNSAAELAERREH